MTKKGKSKEIAAEMPNDVSRRRGWQPARQVADPTSTKLPTQRVTISLDQDIIAVFKAEAFLGGPRYQVAINQALRSFLRDREKSEAQRAAETVLKALDEREVIRKLRRVIKDSAA
ncbi:MAG: BrnA antitoxin family protein [Polyangiaceae bacterium]|nr:BrnA antitoxin family protein [Polyangiaceae bacterium]